jgi:SAM-dependent methyltransferase
MEPPMNLLRHSGNRDPVFKKTIDSVLSDIAGSPDDKCLELSSELERKYVLDHVERIWQNLATIRAGLSVMRCTTRPSILDIGTSPLTFIYKQYLQTVDMFTIDRTALLGERCREHNIDHRVCNLLTEPIPLADGQMDMVVFTEVFEHLNTGPGRIFSEIHRILKPGGTLVFSLPNTAMLKNRIGALLGRPVLEPVYEVFKEEKSEQSQGDGEWVHGLGHTREYTMSETTDIVRRYGFEVQSTQSADAFIDPPDRFSRLRRIAWPVYRIASRIVPNSRMINLVLARKTL